MAPWVLGRLRGAQRRSWKRECEDLGRGGDPFSLPSSPGGHLNISSHAGLAGLVLSYLTQSHACLGQTDSQAWVTLWFEPGYPSQTCSGPVLAALGWKRAQECRSIPGRACAGSQGSARSVPGDRQGVTGSWRKWGHQWHYHPSRQCCIGSSLIPSCRQAGSSGPVFGTACGSPCPTVTHDAPCSAPHPRVPHSAAPHCRGMPWPVPSVCLPASKAQPPTSTLEGSSPAMHRPIMRLILEKGL